MSNWREPITDRTIADVRSYDAGSLEYQKGALNADDLNRIEDNYKYLMAKLRSDAIFIPHRLRNFTETVLECVQTGEASPEYTLVEYLESTGTQYIDTGIKPTSDICVEMDFQLTNASEWTCIFGGRDSSANKNSVALWWNNTFKFYRCASASQFVEFPSTVSTLTEHHFECSGNAANIDGNSVSISDVTFTGANNIYLFASNTVGTAECFASAKLKSCKISNRAGTLLRDYIPVRDKNGVACLYDKVEAKYYYNVGSGDFTAPQTGFTPVGYIKPTGTQYIDTGIVATENIRVEAGFIPESTATNQVLFGASWGNTDFSAAFYSNNLRFHAKGKYIDVPANQITGDIEIIATQTECTVNGTAYKLNGTQAISATNIYIFSVPKGTIPGMGLSPLKYFRIYLGDTLVRDYIPVIDANGEACLYDQLNHKYYRNAGTGSFYAVKPVKLPKGYTQVEYVESSGSQHVDTGVKPNQNTKMILKCAYLGSAGDNVSGVRDSGSESSKRFGIITYGSASRFGCFFGTSSIQGCAIDQNFHTFELSNDGFCVDSTSYGSVGSQNFQCSYSIVLGSWSNGSGGISYTSSKVASCMIYDNGTLVRDFIPCVNAGGVAGMYDLINDVFYTNAGSGTFTVGEEVTFKPETGIVGELIETTTTYTDWRENNLPWLSEINRIRANYNALVRLFLVGLGFHEMSESNYLDYIEVNNWERFALFGKTMFENMEKEYRFCGMEESGGDRLL